MTLQRLIRAAIPLVALPYFFASVASQGQQGGGQGSAGSPQGPPMINQSDDPLLSGFRFRSIGPASMGGRIDDIEVAPSDQNIIYIGYAVSGVWKSENNGTTFEPVFDTYSVASIGDIAIHPTNPNVVYVGTGEANNRQTSSFGDGIYKTTDGGKTFQHIGLRETQTIARVVIDPKNPETVYVAALGRLFGPNPERGVYKTTNGGKTWDLVKFIDNDTGFTDIAIDPSNTSILYAASYQRRRLGCCFNGGGPGSALWKTTDAGKTWTKLTSKGLPPGTYGRIALDVSRSNPNVVYVQIEARQVGQPQTTPPNDPGGASEVTPTRPGTPTPPPVTPQAAAAAAQQQGGRGAAQQAGGRGQGGGGADDYNWCNNAGPGRGFGRGGRGGRGGGEEQPAGPQTPPPLDPSRGGVFRSEDKGATFTLVSNCNLRPMYFSQLRVDPTNDKTVYVAGLPWAKSLDAGKTFQTLDNAGGNDSPGHVDQHAMWIDPKNPRHLIIGNDGGIDVSWDQGRTWDSIKTMSVSLPYWVSADMRRPYYVYVGLQDNGSWGGPSMTRTGEGILNSDWYGVGGGDGFQTAADPTDHNIIYTESQNGNTSRYDLGTGRQQSIRPRGTNQGRGGGRGGAPQPPSVLNAGPKDEAYRFNWNTPFQLSPHNPSIIWLGGNRLFKSLNRGDTWVQSADLTKNVDRNTIPLMGVPGDRSMLSKNDGVTSYSTIIAINESPVMPGVVWVGTDDGLVQVSRDDGRTFTEVGKNIKGLPANHMHWVSRIAASHFDPAVAYVAIDGHRSDDLKPYLYVTRDYGQTWTSIAAGLPESGNIQVVTEDPRNKDLLYVGTEFGLFLSYDGGKSWKKFMNNLPTVRVDHIMVHPRDNDLIVATHGRSVWIVDDISALQQMTPQVRDAAAHLFDVRPAVAWLNDRQKGQQVTGQRNFVGENPQRGAAIHYYLKSGGGNVKLTISDFNGRQIRTLNATSKQGLNRVMWNLNPDPPQGQGQGGGGGGGGGGRGGGGGGVDPGTYLVTLTVGSEKPISKPVTVLQDRWLGER